MTARRLIFIQKEFINMITNITIANIKGYGSPGVSLDLNNRGQARCEVENKIRHANSSDGEHK